MRRGEREVLKALAQAQGAASPARRRALRARGRPYAGATDEPGATLDPCGRVDRLSLAEWLHGVGAVRSGAPVDQWTAELGLEPAAGAELVRQIRRVDARVAVPAPARVMGPLDKTFARRLERMFQRLKRHLVAISPAKARVLATFTAEFEVPAPRGQWSQGAIDALLDALKGSGIALDRVTIEPDPQGGVHVMWFDADGATLGSYWPLPVVLAIAHARARHALRRCVARGADTPAEHPAD